jgi:hypothetical protein
MHNSGFMLPFVSALVHGRIVLTFSETLYDAISESGTPRSAVESVLISSLMVIALVASSADKRILWRCGGRKADSCHHPGS